jgi:hypothetical protein
MVTSGLSCFSGRFVVGGDQTTRKRTASQQDSGTRVPLAAWRFPAL